MYRVVDVSTGSVVAIVDCIDDVHKKLGEGVYKVEDENGSFVTFVTVVESRGYK